MSEKGVTIRVDAETSEAQSRLERFFAGVNGGLGALSGLWAKLGGVLAVGTFIRLEQQAIGAMTALQELSRETGISVGLLSGLREEAEDAGQDFAQLTTALRQFGNQLGTAVRQGGQAAEAFRDLIGTEGLRAFASGANTVDEVLRQVIARFNELPDGPRKVAMAMDLFGRSGVEMIRVLEGVRDGLARGVITPQMARDAEEFQRTMRQLRNEFEEIFIGLAARLLPKLQEVTAWFRDMGKSADGLRNKLALFGSLAAMEFTKAMATGIVDLGMVLGEGFVRFAAWSGNILQKALMSAINSVIMWLNESGKLARLLGGSIQPIALEPMDADAERQIKEMKEGANILKGGLDKFFGTGIEAAKQAFGAAAGPSNESPSGVATSGWGEEAPAAARGPGIPASETARALLQQVKREWAEATQSRLALLEEEERARLEQLEREVLDLEQAEAAKAKVRETYAAKRRALLAQERDAEAEIALARVQGQRQLVEQEEMLTRAQKKEQLLQLMREENRLIEENIQLNRERVAALALNAEARLQAQEQLQRLEKALAENQRDRRRLEREGTWVGEFREVLTGLADAWGSWAEQAASTFRTVFEGAIGTISSGISGLIMGTQRWGEALRAIGVGILSQVVQGIVQIGVRWVLTQVMMATIGKTMMAAAVASAVPMAMASAAIWSAPAALANMATFGGAAAATPGQIAASQGLVLAQSLAMFREGGWTGPGGRDELAGMVHAGEYVFSAPAVERIGLGTLERWHAGALGGDRRGAAPGVQKVAVALTDERRATDLENDPAFEGIVLRVFERNRHRYGG